MRTLNLGVLAHVDAGKTSLTERLLYAAGVIDRVGSVDDGSTQTDSLALERRRGITIKSAVVSFVSNDVTVNLIDTPGHPDFIAEVERALRVLDGAVLVVSAVEGVQPQTRVLMRTLRRLRIPTLVFVNKIDRGGARYDGVLREIADKLTPSVVPMGSTANLGTPGATSTPYDARDPDHPARLVELLADHDDTLLAAYVDGATHPSYPELYGGLAAQTASAQVHPVFFGSAITGAGVDPLMTAITELLPAATGDVTAPVSGTVFKVDRGAAGERIAYVRLFAGTMRVRDQVWVGSAREAKVTAISVFDHGSSVRCTSVTGGQIARIWGLGDIRIGDAVGAAPAASTAPSDQQHQFSPPTLETVVTACRRADRGALHVALTQLAEQDPLIDLRQDDLRQEISVSLYGEVQKEVIQATLAGEFGVDVTFRETTTVCIERPVGTGAAVELIGKEPNPFLATVGLRIEPAPAGTGVDLRLEVELGSMPAAFFTAVREAVLESLQQGLHGWRVTDCRVTITHSGYWARQSHSHGGFDRSMSSTAADFRDLTPLVLMDALRQAGTVVLEPIQHFRLDIPADQLGTVLPALARLGAVPQTSTTHGSSSVVEGEVPVSRVHGLELRLPALTSGEGVLEYAFDRYQPVRDDVPARPRSDHNPLNRKEYLLQVQRKVQT